MGTRGPLPEPTEVTVLPPGVVGEGGELTLPTPPRGLLPVTRRRWVAFWESGLGRVVQEVGLPAVSRLFRYYDEWERLEKEYRAGPRTVEGSQGQQVINPLADRLAKLEDLISRLEDKCGVTPLARARLGIAIGESKLTWQQVSRQGAGGQGNVPELPA